MICRKCCHCGLCPGDRKEDSGSVEVELGTVRADFHTDSSLPVGWLGLAFDLGTTTIACSAYSLADGKLLFSFGEKNRQFQYGSDVVSRISFSMEEEGFEKLRKVVSQQMSEMARKALSICQLEYSNHRKGRVELHKIVVSGNTVMESILAGISTSGLGTYPFVPGSSFGFHRSANQIFGQDFFPEDCTIWFFPVVSAFVGGDAVASMLACGFHDSSKPALLADIGTNCELCAVTEDGKIFCTSTSAGPAFEGYGIECGSIACEGSVSSVQVGNGKLCCSVIGGGKASSLNGTGLVSAVACFLDLGIIDCTGAFSTELENDRCFLDGDVYISQKDIRNFQLAKASVSSGMEILLSRSEIEKCPTVYLSGGFGTKIEIKSAFRTGLVREDSCGQVVSFGNTSMAGAVLALLDEGFMAKAKELVSRCEVIDLAQQKDFQDKFVKAMNF